MGGNFCKNLKEVDNKELSTGKYGFDGMATQNQLTAHSSQTFLITCMDFRLIDDACQAMDKLGYNNNYDQFILAGASLGFVQDKFPHWGNTLMDHLEIGLKLHNFRKFSFIDHKDCGAFKKFLGDQMKTPEDEIRLHQEHLQKAYDKLRIHFPTFDFEAYIMDLHGEVTRVKIDMESEKYIESNRAEENFLTDIHEHKGSWLPKKKFINHTSHFQHMHTGSDVTNIQIKVNEEKQI